MDFMTSAKNDLINEIKQMMVTPNVRPSKHSAEDEIKYNEFIKAVNSGKKATVQLALDFATYDEMFNLIIDRKVFIEDSVKFTTTFTTVRPEEPHKCAYFARYVGNEFGYAFLDNHPGIINVDKLKDIPADYEGLMAVPLTVLEYKNINDFNIYKILYTPKFDGKYIYPRVVVTNKVCSAN